MMDLVLISYIHKDLSIMSCGKISKLIDLNAKQVWNIV